jgi:hypothetical protein
LPDQIDLKALCSNKPILNLISDCYSGHSDPQDHSIIGDTNNIFTSWTSNIAVAREFANRFSSRGIILEKNFDLSKTRYFRSDMNDDVLQESEYLIRGSVFDMKPIIYESK